MKTLVNVIVWGLLMLTVSSAAQAQDLEPAKLTNIVRRESLHSGGVTCQNYSRWTMNCRENQYTVTTYEITVQIGDITYTVVPNSFWGKSPVGTLIVNDPVSYSLNVRKNQMELWQPGTKRIKTKIIQRVRQESKVKK